MAKAKKQEVTTTALPGQVQKGRGWDEPTAKEDYIIPRAKLLQALSPEVSEEDNLKAGMVINSLTKEILPSEFMPIFKFTNWIRFNPRNSSDPTFDPNYAPGAIIWRSDDPEDPRVIEEGRFGEDGSKPLATKFLNFFAIFPGHAMPVILSFSKTSFRAGKKLLTLGSLYGGDAWSHKYTLKVKQEETDGNKYFVLDVSPCGYIDATSSEYKAGENTYENFASKPLNVHEEAPEDITT